MVLVLVAFGGRMKIDYKGHANNNGVYRIINTVNQRVYYGSAKRFKSRFASHNNLLINNKHNNTFLQSDYNKCGTMAFTFEVVEVVEGTRKDRLEREQFYIDQYFDGGKNCYNLRKNVCDTREGKSNIGAIDPATDGRCKAPSEETLQKRSKGLKKVFEDNPELRELCSKRAKEVRWKGHNANIAVTRKETGETVVIQGSVREWCEQNGLSYKAFNQLVNGKIKSSGGWYLGTKKPVYADRKGEKRKPLSQEHRTKIAGGKFKGIELINNQGQKLVLGENVKEQCRELGLHYTTLLKVVKKTRRSVGGWHLSKHNPENLELYLCHE